jgi:sterol desaturase/sphingolipid hydroxylase (fatty acid hydroxylase superfamily)
MIEFFYFLTWTLVLYVIHRIVHVTPILKKIHWEHHRYISIRLRSINHEKTLTEWHWNNLLLFNDNVLSTIDLWITEVIPTLIFSYLTGQWWISIFYYIWAAFLQESLEHNPRLNLYPFTSGIWHLQHHKNYKKNYGLFHPLWDRIFQTEML